VRCGYGWALAVLVAVASEGGAAPQTERLDPLQQSVVDSLTFPPRTTPRELLEAAIRAADVGAEAVAADYLSRLDAALDAAGDGRFDVAADLADAFDAASLARLDRQLRARDPSTAPVLAGIRAAAALRRRDPEVLSRAAGDLTADSAVVRSAAVERLAAAGVDAVPALVSVLDEPADGVAPPVDEGRPVRTAVARRLLAAVGTEARGPLLAWLGSADVDSWAAVVQAMEAAGLSDIDDYLLAPALVEDTPPAARAAALRLLRAGTTGPVPPSPDEAIERLARRLDAILGPNGLPAIDCLMLEPVGDPAGVASAFGGTLTGTVERFIWNSDTRRIERRELAPRAARALDAAHVARDLAALAPEDPAVVRLVLLARLETALVAAPPPPEPAPEALRSQLAGPSGFDPALAVDVFDLAIERGMWEAASAVAVALEPPSGPQDEPPPRSLPPRVRGSLVRALLVPDAGLQYAAARTLALEAGSQPYAGSSRVLAALVHAATATGEDRVIVAHPDAVAAAALATGVSQFGYLPEVVGTGREAVFAARASADTVLVLLAARSLRPSARETVQYLAQPPFGPPPPVLVVVDPLDDDARGCFLQRLILSFRDLPGVGLVDRLDSFFAEVNHPVDGEPPVPARFPDALATVAGPEAVDPTTRHARRLARLARAGDALALIARLGRDGQDVSAALDVARRGLSQVELALPATAVLGVIGRPEAQRMLLRAALAPNIPEVLREAVQEAAWTALAVNIGRHGPLLSCDDLAVLTARYTQEVGAAERAVIRPVLDLLERPGRKSTPRTVDAPPSRPTR